MSATGRLDKSDRTLWEAPPPESKSPEQVSRPSMTYFQDAWRRFRENPAAMFGLCLVAFIVILALLGPAVSSHSYWEQDLNRTNESPGGEYIFGTDSLGRDLFVRVMTGGRISLLVSVIATFISCLIGILYGGFAGYAGGGADNAMMRIVDIIWTIPLMLYAIILMVWLGPGLHNILIAIALVYWVNMARIVRAQVMNLKETEFVLAAKVQGAGTWRILTRHLLPNSMGPILVTATMMIPGAVFTESFLSFIGLGISAPLASWGSLCSDSLGALRSYPYQLFFPAAFICATMLGFNFVGDGLRDALDPRLRR
ncbi:MAG: ABC transporter permease [Synergistaceae bacterium]|jgi:oligopeptide transport system permease protein|nr:ABC transporter permease [Synergistaceae bacterium]